jgi:predicted AlkP superfamily pyrophosphatase or phosphodiesterase
MKSPVQAAVLLLASVCAYAQVDHVIVIGIDGFGAAALRENPTPNIHKLMSEGAWTLKARGVMPTVSSPNWASMIMGAGPEQHGVTSNDWQPDKFEFSPVCTGSAKIFPTIFGILRQQKIGARISILHDWDDFQRLVEPGVATLIQNTPGAKATMEAAQKEWREHSPALMFLHLDDVDHAGHENAWESQQYRDAVAAVDVLVGNFTTAVKQSPEGARTAILLSADHGGVGKKHGGMTMTELEIPWIATGAGIVRSHEITSSVNTFDTAATIAALLKLKTPDCWLGRPVREALAP